MKTIYVYVKDHLSGWFPKLPGYQAFCARFSALANVWMDKVCAMNETEMADSY